MKTLPGAGETDPQMAAVYRHDAHKTRGQSHNNAPDEWRGMPVNADVPYGADADAAAMSRPRGKPTQTIEGHDTHYRRSVGSGTTHYDPNSFALQHIEDELTRLLEAEPVGVMHSRWLKSTVASGFNEAVYYPYTSLKYHTILVAVLVWWYRDGYEYDDLGLYLQYPDKADRPETIYDGNGFSLAIAPHERGKSAKLSSYPMQNFASVWMRLPAHAPLAGGDAKAGRWIDAQLRRIKSWSTALQYLENAQSEVGQ